MVVPFLVHYVFHRYLFCMFAIVLTMVGLTVFSIQQRYTLHTELIETCPIYKEVGCPSFYLNIWPSWHMSHFPTSGKRSGYEKYFTFLINIKNNSANIIVSGNFSACPQHPEHNGAHTPSNAAVILCYSAIPAVVMWECCLYVASFSRKARKLGFCLNLLLLFMEETNKIFLKDFIYLIFREGKGGRKRRRETSMCGCLSRAPYWEPGLQPRHVP